MTRSALVFTMIWLLLGTLIVFSVGPVDANPIPVDHDRDGMPVPSNNFSVYLSEEVVIVTIGKGQATVNGTYTFSNLGSNDTSLDILFPFEEVPDIAGVWCDGGPVEHGPGSLTVLYKWRYRNLNGTIFHIDVPADGASTVNIRYSRSYERPHFMEDPKVYYSFMYVVWTARCWNHSIDHARFEFWIPKDMYEGLEHTSGALRDEGGYKVVIKEFFNWTPTYDHVGVIWWDNWEDDSPFSGLIWAFMIGGIILFLCFMTYLLIKGPKPKRGEDPGQSPLRRQNPQKGKNMKMKNRP